MPVNILALPIAQSRFLRVVSKTGRRQPTRKGDLEFMQDQSATSKPWLHGMTMRQQWKKNRTLLNVLNKEHDKQIKDNWEYMKTIAEVLLTATQNIAQRGHDESAESDNRGNFIAIAKRDKTVKKRLHSIHNAKYTSKAIQNEGT